MSPQLSVVIVNFRTPAFVIDCLTTLLPELDGMDARVVIVDNHSADNSPEIIRAWLAQHDAVNKVLFVQSEHNSGFASGNNIGIKSCNARYYLLLNSDTLIRPGAIRIILDTATRFPEAGLVSPRLEWPDGVGQESCFRFPTPFSELIAAAQTGLISRCFSRYIVALPVQTQIARPQWTSFACVLVTDEVFQQVGLLDEGYFMYFEDVEFCRRARKAGWEIVHNPDARVVHLRGGSSPVKKQTRLKKRVPRYFYESRTRYYYQASGWFGMMSANLLWWAGRSVSGIRQLLGRSDKGAIEGQWLDIWTNWHNPLKHYTPPNP
ncbi:MAG: glycosyltransferase family 2 protein [Nitrosomonadales bacterium]|nr:glycosyltransferase family 2 protein [Nitrosomonadales bacterium]